MTGDLLDGVRRFLVRNGYLAQDTTVESFEDAALMSAVAKYQQLDANVRLAANDMGFEPIADGVIGPATRYAMSLPRCGHPDSDAASPALGVGGWKNCHGADGFHQATALVNPQGLPSFLKPHWLDVLGRVQKAYASIGLLWRFCESRSGRVVDLLTGDEIKPQGINVDISFTRGSGWIGLAIVGNSSIQQCASRIWAKFDYRYQPRDIVTQWVTLVKHELGHNCGLRHSNGGVMNPGIINGLPNDWSSSDPSTSTLKRWFGGDPVDVPGSEPPPPDPPAPGEWPAPGQPVGSAFSLPNGKRVQLFSVMGGK